MISYHHYYHNRLLMINNNFRIIISLWIFVYFLKYVICDTDTINSDLNLNNNNNVSNNKIQTHYDNFIRINKCCEKFEILFDTVCTVANDTNRDTWKPILKKDDGKTLETNFTFVIGIPKCGSMQSWSIYHYTGSSDELVLLPDGKLRHYIRGINEKLNESDDDDDDIENDSNKESLYYDYNQGQYCMEKGISNVNGYKEFMYAEVCSQLKEEKWTDIEFVLRKIINPIFHIMSIVFLLIVAIVYYILPGLRDLVGNIITTITICLIVFHAADLARIFTEFSNHINFLVVDSILYISILGAFFWLNSFGYYIWKTFRSRNVFLKISDSRKYCWYSCYAWGATFTMSSLAIFSHHFLDSTVYKQQKLVENQETIGWLGIAMFFSPIAILILINVFFYVSTAQLISKRSIYGRIQHRLKINFTIFSILFLIMSISWLFLMLSWLNYDGLLYTHILISSIQSPIILYICVIRQKHILFLLKKTCCYNQSVNTTDFGDEMVHMNGGGNYENY